MSNTLLSDLSKRVKRFGKAANVVPGTYMSAAGIQTEIHPTTLARLAVHETKYRRLVHVYRQDLQSTVFNIRRDQRLLRKAVSEYQNKWRYNRTHRFVSSATIRNDATTESTKKISKSRKKVRILLPLETVKDAGNNNGWLLPDGSMKAPVNPIPPIPTTQTSSEETTGDTENKKQQKESSSHDIKSSSHDIKSSSSPPYFGNIIENSSDSHNTHQSNPENQSPDRKTPSISKSKLAAKNPKAMNKLLKKGGGKQQVYLTPVSSQVDWSQEKAPLPAIKVSDTSTDQHNNKQSGSENVQDTRARRKGIVDVPHITVTEASVEENRESRPESTSTATVKTADLSGEAGKASYIPEMRVDLTDGGEEVRRRRPSLLTATPPDVDRSRRLSIPAKQVDKFLLREKLKTENRGDSFTWQQKLTSIKDVHRLTNQNDYEQFALNVLQEMDETYKPI